MEGALWEEDIATNDDLFDFKWSPDDFDILALQVHVADPQAAPAPGPHHYDSKGESFAEFYGGIAHKLPSSDAYVPPASFISSNNYNNDNNINNNININNASDEKVATAAGGRRKRKPPRYLEKESAAVDVLDESVAAPSASKHNKTSATKSLKQSAPSTSSLSDSEMSTVSRADGNLPIMSSADLAGMTTVSIPRHPKMVFELHSLKSASFLFANAMNSGDIKTLNSYFQAFFAPNCAYRLANPMLGTFTGNGQEGLAFVLSFGQRSFSVFPDGVFDTKHAVVIKPTNRPTRITALRSTAIYTGTRVTMELAWPQTSSGTPQDKGPLSRLMDPSVVNSADRIESSEAAERAFRDSLVAGKAVPLEQQMMLQVEFKIDAVTKKIVMFDFQWSVVGLRLM